MSDLVAFLNARLDEDEAAAKAALEQSTEEGTRWWFDDAAPETPREFHVARWDPARVLREVEAERKILDFAFRNAAAIDGEWGDGHEAEDIRAGMCSDCGNEAAAYVLKPLAAVYSDHPDYQQEWA
jgi:Family of unknown function (DUF6221)